MKEFIRGKKMRSSYKRTAIAMFTLFALIMLSGCGGGGGNNSVDDGTGDNGSEEPTPTPEPVVKTFTVGLGSVQVVQISTGDALTVDTESVTGGDLEYTVP
ncbi:hypothetical protein [Microbulbifer sp. ALW1]|uniref:hypothetical protein n=1 Tax=Microbulbifer sp. (strain ALW1) TaxID=1516059 RepID=UPI001356DAE0|nr:hypothetical protein [Microbulbifer sp. ALW1]